MLASSSELLKNLGHHESIVNRACLNLMLKIRVNFRAIQLHAGLGRYLVIFGTDQPFIAV